MHVSLLATAALVIGPLFGVVVDLVYALILVLMVDRMRLTQRRAVIVGVAVCTGMLLFATNPFASSPYFSYFFLRISLLLLVFLWIPRTNSDLNPGWVWTLFVVYVLAIVYQYLALPGSEWLDRLHAERLVESDIAYRSSGLFSGYFSAATVIGSLGVILILRSGIAGTSVAALMMLVVAFCSGRSVIIYLLVAMLMQAIKRPRVAIWSACALIATVLIVFSIAAERISADGDLGESVILFKQILNILSGDVRGTSTEALFDKQYYLPDDPKTLLIGNNERPFTPLGVKSDSGYVQLLFGTGLIGSLVYLALLTGIFFRPRNTVVFTLFTAALIVSFKGNTFNAIGVLDIMLLCCHDRRVGGQVDPARRVPSLSNS